MGQLPVVQLAPSFPPFVLFREQLGFVPNLFRAQTLVPRLLEAEASLMGTLLFRESVLSRIQKEYILTAVSASQSNAYGVGWHTQMLRLSGVAEERALAVATDFRTASLPSADTSLLRFAVKLGAFGPLVSSRDIETLLAAGFSSDGALDAILLTALAVFLCTLAAILNPEPDFAPWTLPLGKPEALLEDEPEASEESQGPYLAAAAGIPPEFDDIRQIFGFVPNLYRPLASRPDVLRAKADVIGLVMLDHSLLSRERKELLVLAVSAANANTYCVALQGEILRALGVPLEVADQAAGEQHGTDTLPDVQRALVDFGRQRAGAGDLEALRRLGFTDEQILEAIVTAALANFRSTLQNGLGTLPDVPPRHVYRPAPMKKEHPPALQPHQRARGPVEPDLDVALVEAAREGDMNAFEELVHRHGRRVYRTLAAILGDPEEARDAMQDTFLKAFNCLSSFEGRSKFATWLLTVAANGGLQRLRERKPMESLDAAASESGEDFRPRQVQAWTDNPEQKYAKLEMQRIVEQEVRKLPAKYRVVVVLRDIEQISTEEAASVLGLGVPALKARLLRARLMLREALTPHFSEPAAAGARR